jgi:signal transduction histidine kinase
VRSLLAIPILCDGPFRGNLYVAEKQGAVEFSPEDEEILQRFATKVTIAIDNAHLHQRLQNLAITEERLRIAREMHDGMAQVLAYVNTKAQAVKEYLRQERLADASDQLEQLAAAAREVYTDAREGILALRTPVGPDRSLSEALEDFMAQWQDQCGIAGELETDENLQLSPAAELQLLRIIQESLSNVRKHARASRARVEVRRNHEHIQVVVEDDGSGFDLASRSREGFPRFGLAIMRERAESIGGSFEIDSAADQGTRLTVRVPLRAESV